MAAITKPKVIIPQKGKKTSTTTEGNSLKNIYGLYKGKISYDKSIFNFGKRKVGA